MCGHSELYVGLFNSIKYILNSMVLSVLPLNAVSISEPLAGIGNGNDFENLALNMLVSAQRSASVFVQLLHGSTGCCWEMKRRAATECSLKEKI